MLFRSPTFAADAKDLWTEEERGAFCAWLSAHPEAGDVIPGSGGCRKVRWSRPGKGKSGGVRVIYFTRLTNDLPMVNYGYWSYMQRVFAETSHPTY